MLRDLWTKMLALIKNHPNRMTLIILGVLTVIFISPAFFQQRYLAPVDIYHYVAPYLDITTQMLPWYKLSSELIHHGHFPLWNIYSGLGLPLLANMQTAVFFPLTWLFYLFNIKAALLLYAFTKLLLMGLFTYWYLRELKFSYYVSLLGAVMFMFCGANAIWFLWPLTNVLLILPLSFWLLEKYFQRGDLRYALWLTPAVALGLLAGHPQTFFYIFCAIYAYTVFKVCSSPTWRQGVIRLGLLTGLYLAGFLMSAIATLPFLEYVRLSANLDYRAGFAENPFYLAKALFLTNLIPDFYGNLGLKNFTYLPVPNYGELALGYFGLSGLVLALLAFTRKVKTKTVWFFAGGAVFTLTLIYHAPLIYHWVNRLPGFNLNYNNRLLYLWAFFGIILACYGLENLLQLRVSKKRLNWTWLCFAVFAAGLIVVNKIVTQSWPLNPKLTWSLVHMWQNVLIAGFAVNLVLVYIVIRNLPKRWALAALFLMVFVETGVHGMIFLRTAKPENFYPAQPALTFLQQAAPYRVFTYGHNLLPNIGTWYGINELNDHDTIYLRSNKKIKQAIATYNYSPEYTFDEPNLEALRFLGTKYLLYPGPEAQTLLQKHPNDLAIAITDERYTILSLNQVLPRAFFLPARSSEELQQQLTDLVHDSKAHAVTTIADFQQAQDGTQTITYQASGDGYLVTTDNYYPSWIAKFANGQMVAVEDAGGLRAVPVKAGPGMVSISYQPNSLRLGLTVSVWVALFWFAAIVMFMKGKGGSSQES